MTVEPFRRMLARHATAQVAAQGVALVCGLVMAAVLSRHLGVDGFGSFSYLFAFIYFFLALNDLGVQTIVVREISQQPDRTGAIVGAMLSFRVIAALVSLVFSWAVILWMGFPRDLAWSLALFSWLLPLSALKLPVAVFQARLKI
jgi:O-antigen/teichoic acid export membrane protein